MSHPVERAKQPAKMSFWSEDHAAKLESIPAPGPRAIAAARRLISRQPDADLLEAILIGDMK